MTFYNLGEKKFSNRLYHWCFLACVTIYSDEKGTGLKKRFRDFLAQAGNQNLAKSDLNLKCTGVKTYTGLVTPENCQKSLIICYYGSSKYKR